MRLVDTIKFRELVDVGDQRAWSIAREPQRFGLPSEAIVRVGRSIRWNLDLVEQWIARGGSSAKGSEREDGDNSRAA